MYSSKGIRCNAIAPGGVNTNIMDGVNPNNAGLEIISKGMAIEISRLNSLQIKRGLKKSLYLQQFDIRQHHIISFGAAKKLLIYNNGIRNAADVSKLKNIKIAGIGPKSAQILFDWQRLIGTGFIYTPDIKMINNEIVMVSNEISSKRQRLETDIKAEYKNLTSIRANILSHNNSLERQYLELSKQLYQSELDLKEFQKLLK
jgi:DNA-binding helix-hairpin-helix protein with protein kinase domain